jgi:lysophospholipid acyltransferase (LPLAT)-like uncharacterized protein
MMASPNPSSLERESGVEAGSSTKAGVIERLKFGIVSLLGYWIIRIIGRTLRWQAEGWENYRAIEGARKNAIFAFWHGRLFMATYFFRNRGIVVMISRNKDGEYIARVIKRFGYGTARGSSSRGSRGAMVELMRELRRDRPIGFTLDGPRGPRYVAKPGAVWIASKSGDPLFPFHISAEKKWVLTSWDQFQIPKPFTRARVCMGAPIYVKPGATEEEIEDARQNLQSVLEDLRARGDSYWT